MLVLITYDVSLADAAGVRRLRRIAKVCVNYGQRVQNSVFECRLNRTQLTEVRHQLECIMDINKDSIRIYRLGENSAHKVEHMGKTEGSYDPDEPLIV